MLLFIGKYKRQEVDGNGKQQQKPNVVILNFLLVPKLKP